MLLSVSGLQRDRRIGSHPRRGVKGKKKEKAKDLLVWTFMSVVGTVLITE